MVWRCPDGGAQAAGIHVMGVGKVAHHEESPLSGVEVSVQVHPSRRHSSCGRTGGSITWGIPVWAWQAPGGPGEKAADAPAGRVMLTVGKLDARRIHHTLDLEAAA